MILLADALAAWGGADFSSVLKRSVEQLDHAALPLQQGLSIGSVAVADGLSAMVIDAWDDDAFVHAKVGLFYQGIVAGCSCADDPTPVEAQPEYCVVRLDIDRRTAETAVTLVPE
jgi:hypothetical protein